MGRRSSISQLTAGSSLTRQAVTKHLRVLENAGIVRHARMGRESRFAFNPQPLEGLREYLEGVSAQWDDALSRLKSLVETLSESPRFVLLRGHEPGALASQATVTSLLLCRRMQS